MNASDLGTIHLLITHIHQFHDQLGGTTTAILQFGTSVIISIGACLSV